MYYLSVASSDLCCAYLCHFFMPFAFQARGLCLHCWYLSMIKYLVTFKLKQQDIPENNCGSIFSIGLIIICRLNNYKEQVMPHGKCGLDWIFSVQITGLEETFLCSYKFIQLCSPPPRRHPSLIMWESWRRHNKGSRFLPTHLLYLPPHHFCPISPLLT